MEKVNIDLTIGNKGRISSINNVTTVTTDD
jgi:hypothetical protein